MNEKKFNRIIKNPRHIPGVYNYCDRWCERCPLTLRCSVYAVGEVEDKDRHPDGHDRAAETLWPRLESLQPFADELLVKHADHPGVAPAPNPKFKSHDRPVDSAPVGSAAKRYMEFAHAFVNDHQKTLPALPAQPDFPVTPAEAFEIIAFYHFLITVKLSRALSRDEIDDEMENDPELAAMPSDQDGSAKIVLIAIDRSIIAWLSLTRLAPDLTTTALSAALTLHRLRLGVERQFPKARPFVRPGFDTLRFH